MRALTILSVFAVLAALPPLAFPALAQENGIAYYALDRIGARMNQPTGLAHAGDDLLYISERAGRILILEEEEFLRTPFLNVEDSVDAEASVEQGLLGLAFDPDYAENGYFYIAYTDADFSLHLERYQASAYRYVALPGSRERLLSIEQASPLHKGGHLRFGPDGYLYLSVGDGGISEDLDSTGQNTDDLRGKILRLDVSDGRPYAIPPDNPFVDADGYRPEIWLMGLRNPWKFSFVQGSRALFIADVGWASSEEINFLPAESRGGENFGWRIYEGELLTEADKAPNANEGLTFPVFSYPHIKPLGYDGSFPVGCAVIGGHVYRGAAMPELQGLYIYSDYCHGDLWTLRQDAAGWQTEKLYETDLNITAIGEDARGELYITGLDGRLYKLIHAPDGDNDNDSVPNEGDNCPLISNRDQADNWGRQGVGDACDQDYYFSKAFGAEVKMFQQHYGAFHMYACNHDGCGFVANLEPGNLDANAMLRLQSEHFGWTVEAAFVSDDTGQVVYNVLVYDDDGAYYVNDLQLLIAEGSLSWRYASQ
ncbi:MAG: PQQ-dependent sugar dehydrogenase [Chloroflexota bacterium]|nr:PQQ-dependent sugar dehydrogenase [Chloroflexota bacterium]